MLWDSEKEEKCGGTFDLNVSRKNYSKYMFQNYVWVFETLCNLQVDIISVTKETISFSIKSVSLWHQLLTNKLNRHIICMKKNVVAMINYFNNFDEMGENYHNKSGNYILHMLI